MGQTRPAARTGGNSHTYSHLFCPFTGFIFSPKHKSSGYTATSEADLARMAEDQAEG